MTNKSLNWRQVETIFKNKITRKGGTFVYLIYFGPASGKLSKFCNFVLKWRWLRPDCRSVERCPLSLNSSLCSADQVTGGSTCHVMSCGPTCHVMSSCHVSIDYVLTGWEWRADNEAFNLNADMSLFKVSPLDPLNALLTSIFAGLRNQFRWQTILSISRLSSITLCQVEQTSHLTYKTILNSSDTPSSLQRAAMCG